AGGGGGGGGRHGRQTVAGGRRLHRIAAQPLLQDVPVGGVVVHDQHGHAAQHGRGRGGGRLRRVRLEPEAGREGKRATLARLAFHGYLPAPEGHQAGRDGQAQAGTALFPRGGGVLPLRGTEGFSPPLP